ncbi:MAG: hypothetical protein WKG00_08000 [Polyangiaceae bacterium]
MALLALGVGLGVGCASQLTDVVGGDGDDGDPSGTGSAGGAGQVGSGGTGSSGSDGGSTASSSTASTGGDGASGGAGSGPGGSGAGGSAPCPQGQHFCGGVCAGNTTQTGCVLSDRCAPCAAPVNGTSSCTAAGACDFTCGAGWMKSGAQCVCANECCSDSECSNGETCVSGTCTAPPPTCDLAECIFECGLTTGCPGVCLGSACTCLTPC